MDRYTGRATRAAVTGLGGAAAAPAGGRPGCAASSGLVPW